MPTPVAGYSGTPLPKKLGLKEGGVMVLLNAPASIEQWLQPLPVGASLVSKLAASNALVVLFCKDVAALKKSLPAVSKKLLAEGSLWISWPKKSSKLFVDLTEDGIREVVLPTGLVDVKVCAVNGLVGTKIDGAKRTAQELERLTPHPHPSPRGEGLIW